jgi:vancomycin resistance protein YoaR
MSDSRAAGHKRAGTPQPRGARAQKTGAGAMDAWTPAAPQSRKARKKKARNVWWAGPVSAALVCTLVVVGLYCADRIGDYRDFLQKRAQVDRTTFYPGLTIGGVDVSDMDYATALAHFQALDQQRESAYFVELTYGDRVWTLEAGDFGYASDYRRIVESAWAAGRYGSFEERYTAISRAAGEWSRDYAITQSIDRSKLFQILQPIASELTQPGTNAQVRGFSTTKLDFSFEEGTVGYIVDAEALMAQVLDKVEQGGGTLEIVREEVRPPMTAAQLAEQFGKVSTATTNASSSTSNRLTNIHLACKALDGLAVQPGETFSFNKALGQRTTKKGYRPAGALENGMHTQQVGGGICQVSTTLFNAVAKADLEIVERSPHSIPSTYVDLGKDAAVNWPNQDLKFKNNGLYPIYIAARLGKDKRVTISIHGKNLDDGVTIQVVSKRTGVYNPGSDKVIVDASLMPGERVVVEKARKGYSAETYRVYYNAKGKEIDRRRLFKSTYRSAGAVVRVGR